MNIFHLNCRNARTLVILLALVVSIYITLNIVYLVAFESVSIDDRNIASPEVRDPKTVDGSLKFGRPDASGKIEVVVSLDVKQLAQLLGNSQLEGLLGPQNAESAMDTGNIPTGSLPINVTYILYNPAICQGVEPSTLLWIAAINSQPENSVQRSVLRETWANNALFKKNISRTVFLLGTSNDASVQASIRAEFDKYHDIVQGDFTDVTRNATLKGIMALHFISQYCPHAKYYLKANDDSFLNVFEMTRLMEENIAHKQSVICPLWKDNTMPILRDPKDCMQWCVTENELPGLTHFPQYCAGLAFIISQELVPALYRASLVTPYFWIDDVYITGILMPHAVKNPSSSIHFVDLISNFTLVEDDAVTEYADTKKPIRHTIARIHNTQVLRKVWHSLIQRLPPSQFKMLSDSAMAKIDATK